MGEQVADGDGVGIAGPCGDVLGGGIVQGELAVLGEEEDGGGGELFGDGREPEVGAGGDLASGPGVGYSFDFHLNGLAVTEYEEGGAGIEEGEDYGEHADQL